FVGPDDVARSLCAGAAASTPGPAGEVTSPTLQGATGNEDALPFHDVTLAFDHALKPLDGRFVVVGHHVGGATTDDCGASENRLEAIRLAPAFGANVLEVDVQLSADGVPFLFHDDNFSERLTQGPFCHGPVSALTFANIRANCKLEFGETVP